MELNRQTFKQNGTLEFFSEKELSMQIGHSRRFWPMLYCLMQAGCR